MNVLKLLKEPASVSYNQLTDVKIQNDILKKSLFLHTAFGCIKLLNIANEKDSFNTLKPKILAGSVCLCCHSIYYTNEDIELVDSNIVNGNRYIVLKMQNNGLELKPAITSVFNAEYDNELQGFYNPKRKNGIEMYLNLSMYYLDGEYRNKYTIEKYSEIVNE